MRTEIAIDQRHGGLEQVGALIVRRRRGSCEVMLITSRDTGRWIVPKGWPMRGKPDDEAAAQEAFEEAGVEGEISRDPVGSFVAKINSYTDPGRQDSDETLSRREREVLALIAQGASDKAIAATLKLSVNTVKNHVQRIYQKTSCRKRAEAVVWGRQRGILNHVFERNN